MATSSHAKAGRLPEGVESQENLTGTKKREFVDMEAGKTAGASPRDLMWYTVNWPKVHRNVRSLQMRIVKSWDVPMAVSQKRLINA